MNENPTVVLAYNTVRTERMYKVVLSPQSMYAGTYILDTTITTMFNKICKQLDIDPTSTDYHPDQLDFDAQELAVFSLLKLVTDNREIVSIERI